MKKALFLLLLALLITQFHCQFEEDDNLDDGDCYEEDGISKVKDCENRNHGDYYKCCLWEYKIEDKKGNKGTEKYCGPVTEAQYKDIKKYIEYCEKEEKEDEEDLKSLDISIDCNSNYVSFALLSLILILL